MLDETPYLLKMREHEERIARLHLDVAAAPLPRNRLTLKKAVARHLLMIAR